MIQKDPRRQQLKLRELDIFDKYENDSDYGADKVPKQNKLDEDFVEFLFEKENDVDSDDAVDVAENKDYMEFAVDVKKEQARRQEEAEHARMQELEENYQLGRSGSFRRLRSYRRQKSFARCFVCRV